MPDDDGGHYLSPWPRALQVDQYPPESEAKVRKAENSRMKNWNPQCYLTLGLWGRKNQHRPNNVWPVPPVWPVAGSAKDDRSAHWSSHIHGRC